MLGGCMSETVDAIISIHPGYADAILAGQKTIELRRRIPTLTNGSRLWIYATRPMSAIVGVVTIREVAKASPSTIWRRHRAGAGVDHASFNEYFAGAQEAVAILLTAAERISPITLEQLRRIRERFHPPQVLLRLTDTESKALWRLAHNRTAFAEETKSFL
jgi:predicted transcriptional regulator